MVTKSQKFDLTPGSVLLIMRHGLPSSYLFSQFIKMQYPAFRVTDKDEAFIIMERMDPRTILVDYDIILEDDRHLIQKLNSYYNNPDIPIVVLHDRPCIIASPLIEGSTTMMLMPVIVDIESRQLVAYEPKKYFEEVYS